VTALPEGEPFMGEKPLLVGEVDAEQTERLCLIRNAKIIMFNFSNESMYKKKKKS
jgi:hypothetical protein